MVKDHVKADQGERNQVEMDLVEVDLKDCMVKVDLMEALVKADLV